MIQIADGCIVRPPPPIDPCKDTIHTPCQLSVADRTHRANSSRRENLVDRREGWGQLDKAGSPAAETSEVGKHKKEAALPLRREKQRGANKRAAKVNRPDVVGQLS